MTAKAKTVISSVVQIGFLALIALGSFSATAFAAGAVDGTDQSLLDLLKPVYEAFKSGQYVAGCALGVILIVALLKKYAPGKLGRMVHSDAGGALTTFMVSAAGSIAAAAANSAWKWSMLSQATIIAFAAAGGYAMVKKAIIEPLLASKWYQDKAPGWLRAAMSVVLWIFDKPASDATVIAESEKAGADAVTASPSQGVDGVVPPAEKF